MATRPPENVRGAIRLWISLAVVAVDRFVLNNRDGTSSDDASGRSETCENGSEDE